MTDQPTSPAIQPPETDIQYRILFENSPVSIWEEDFSAVKTLFDKLRHEGITDIEAYFEKQPESVLQCADLVKIIDVNRATLKLHGANSKEELLAGLANTFTPESFDTFREELACLWHGETELQRDAVVKTLAGEPRNVTIYFTVCPGYEETLGRAFVSLIDITERKQSEQALFDSELRMTRFIANLPAFFFTFRKSADGRLCFPYASPGIKTLYGLEPKDVREDMAPLHMLAHPEDRPHIEACLEEAFSTLEPFHMEYRVCRPGMPERWLECRSITVPDSDGNPLWHGIMLDITDRKEAAEALVISERKYRTLAGVIPDNIIRYDREGRVTYLNPTLEKTLGIHASDRIGKRVREFHTDGSYEAYAQAIDTVLATGEELEFEFILPKSDPPRIHAMHMVAEHNEQGEIDGALAISHDITERKQKEKELLASEQQFRSLVENSPDNIVRYDRECRLIYYNPTMAQNMPFDAELALGKTPEELGFGGHGVSAEYEKHIRQVLQNGESSDMELTVPNAQGEPRNNLVRFTAEYDTQDEVSGVLAIGRDITELKQAEQERQLHTDFLAKLDRINRAIQGAEDIETMMGNVLDETLSIFDCDRAVLVHPCDPDAATWASPMERTSPDYPGLGTKGLDIPMDQEVAAMFELMLKTRGVVKFGPGTDRPLPKDDDEIYNIKSFMAVALFPKTGKPWQLGLHQCSYGRLWTEAEEQLLMEIARRLTDGLTGMLIQRDLIESEAKYRRIVDTANEGILILNKHAEVVFLNVHLAKMLGYTLEDLQNHHVTDFMLQEDLADHQQKLTRRHQNLAETYERRLIRKDGSILWTLISAAPIFDGNQYRGALSMVTDITALKEAEHKLKRALEVTEGIINAIPDNLFEVDDKGVYLNVWTRNPEQLAAPKEELLGKRADEMLPPEAAAKAMAAIREADEKGISLDNIIRLDLPDGSHWFEHSLSKVPSDDPAAPPHFVVLSRDVTERMRVEEALRASEQRFHAIFNQSFQFIGLMSTDGTLLEANHAATEFTGIDRSEVLGKPFWEGPWWSHSTELQQQLRDAVRDAAGGQFVRMEVTHPDANGNVHYVDFSLTPVTDTDGKVIQLIPEGRDITERKLTEEALRHEQMLLNRIMLTSPVGIAMVNRKGQITFANPQAEKILGLNKEEITQRSYNAPEWNATTIDGEPMPDEAQPFSRVMAARKPVFDVQHAITWPDGRHVLLSINGSPIFDAQNEIEAVVFAIEDITERKKVEAALQRSEQSLAESQRIAHLGGWHMDLTTNEVYWSEELYKMYGFDPSLPPPLFTESKKLFTPESWERLSNAVELATTTGEPYELELELVREDGLNRWMLARGEMVRDESGKGVMVRGVVMDISERKQAEEKLRKSEHGLAEAQRIAHLGNWELDLINDSLIWSDEIYKIFEIDKEQFGASYEAFLDMIHPDERDSVNKAYTESLKTKKPYDIVHRLLMKDGRIKYVHERCETYFDQMSKPLRSVGTVQDITEQKLKEDELIRYRHHLEEEVHQRTTELRLARDAAEAASKAKSLFLANMSHELRTPLNAILGFSQVMQQDENLSTNQHETLDIINHSGTHLLKLINDVLEIAKIEAGKLQLVITAFDLQGLVREVSDMMRLRAQQKGLQLELDQSSEFPRYIKGDEARLRQILVNLVSNAVKFTEKGGVTIRLRTKENKQQHLLIEVSDTGPGISKEDGQRLFKPFVQLPEGTSHGGTGLGLSIVRQFVQLMDGTVTMESTPGKGSIFCVELPLEVTDYTEIIQLSEKYQGDVTGLAPGQPSYRILIAEDQYDNQLLLKKLMNHIGFEVKIAKNGEECVQLFKEWHPDLIWMDRRMPVMDGVEATRRIRRLRGGKKVKIVAVTASVFKEQQPELLDAGMDDYIRKPFQFSEIYNSLAQQLGIKFTYRKAIAETRLAAPALLTPQHLATISGSLRDELHKALESLDRDRIVAVIKQISVIDSTLGRALSQRADEFDYPSILEALEKVAGE